VISETRGLTGWKQKTCSAIKAASRLFQVASISDDGAVPMRPGWEIPAKRTPGMWRDVAYTLENVNKSNFEGR